MLLLFFYITNLFWKILKKIIRTEFWLIFSDLLGSLLFSLFSSYSYLVITQVLFYTIFIFRFSTLLVIWMFFQNTQEINFVNLSSMNTYINFFVQVFILNSTCSHQYFFLLTKKTQMTLELSCMVWIKDVLHMATTTTNKNVVVISLDFFTFDPWIGA